MEGLLIIKIDGIEKANSLKGKIAKIDALIDSLYTAAMKSVNAGNVAEYSIDTGQTVNRVKYTTLQEVIHAIEGYERIRSMYENKLIGRRVTLMDQSNFKRR